MLEPRKSAIPADNSTVPGVNAQVSSPSAYVGARKAFSREDWQGGIAEFETAAATGIPSDAADRLLFAIAKIRLVDDEDAIAALDVALIREAEGEAILRRYLVRHYHKAGRLQAAVAALEKLLEAFPDLADARRLLAGVFARLKRWDEAIANIDAAAALASDDIVLQAGRIQYRLLARQMVAAADLARELRPRIAPNSREAHVVMTALLRGGYARDAAEIAVAIDPKDFPAPHVAAIATEALVEAGMIRQAIVTGEGAIAAGQDSGVIRAHLGEAILQAGRPQEIATRAIDHLRAGVEQEPDHGRINALYGEALLRAGRHDDAIPPFEKALATSMTSPKTRGLYARALRYAGRYEDCADQYVELLSGADGRWATHRQAVGALQQAGRQEEASNVFNEMIAKRNAALAPTFAGALADLDSKAEAVRVPQIRLDWAWQLRGEQSGLDRAEWERRARWGMLADALIVDWMECREQQSEEAMAILDDLDAAEAALEPHRGQGLMIATAHLGPVFSGPILLELLGYPSRWIASTPSIAVAHYSASVISTSDQTDSQVVKACLKGLQAGYAVAIAVDGSGRVGAPTLRFEGQDIAYSSFAARAAHRAGVPSVFYAPRWSDGRGRVQCLFKPMPSPKQGEDVAQFSERWRVAYLTNVRECLADAPENLRLAGGLWSCIRPAS